MKFALFSRDIGQVEELIQTHERFREVFVNLMVRERENKKYIQPRVQAQINVILDKHKDTPKKKRKDPMMLELQNYIYEEENREEDEWESLVLYFEVEEELKVHIGKSWGKRHFMTELFTFFEEANLSDSKPLQDRSVLVCDIIGEMLFYTESKGKSWFWKFRHILYKMEEYFLLNNIEQEILKKIFYKYIYFRDFHQAENLVRKLGPNVDSIKCQIIISFAKDEEIEIDTLLNYQEQLTRVSLKSQ